ncbi:kinase-like domain-containing protein, partial [Ochromonadaceae sp. CCMP2298]
DIPYAHLAAITNNFSRASFIGEGGSGEVYRGEFRGLWVTVIVKRFRGGGESSKSLLREMRVLSTFRHRNIITVYGMHVGEHPCILLEDAAMGDLKACLAADETAKQLDWKERFRIISEIGSAINHMHTYKPQHPAYHGDVKTANIVLTDHKVAKLIDYGMSRYQGKTDSNGVFSRNSFTLLGEVGGTKGYVDPYLCRGTGYVAASEIYSFGVVMADLLTGTSP